MIAEPSLPLNCNTGPVTIISVKRLATGIAEYEVSWSGSSPYYEISYYNPELNITNKIGHTNHSSFIAKFNISNTTLVDNLMIKFCVVGIPNDASMLPSDPSTSEQIQLGMYIFTVTIVYSAFFCRVPIDNRLNVIST